MGEIINKVQQSGLITIDLEEYYPKEERVEYDLAQNLWQGLALKEKDFREFVSANDWSVYKNKLVAITCTADAIVPTWAFMLVSGSVQPYAKKIIFGNLQELESAVFSDIIQSLDANIFRDARVVIKGCSNKPVPVNAYVKLTAALKPFAKSIMYGEPCSTVPLYKAKKD